MKVALEEREEGEILEGIPLMPFANLDKNCVICACMTFFGADPKNWGNIVQIFPPKSEWISDEGYFSGEYAAFIRQQCVEYAGEREFPSTGPVITAKVFPYIKSMLIDKRIISLARAKFVFHEAPPIRAILRRKLENQLFIFHGESNHSRPCTSDIPLRVVPWRLVSVIISIPRHVFTLINDQGIWYKYDDDRKRRVGERSVREWIYGQTGEASRWHMLMYAR
ncbi:MAG: hypothetical protein KBC64_04125 [Simkaniaceae bacterium]|nr:hypothetical protein [Simkaniaceae bacterium]